MTPAEVSGLITLAVGFDPRLQVDADTSRARHAAWSLALRDADPEEALAAVRRYYSEPQRFHLQIGHLVAATRHREAPGAWRAELPAVGSPMPDDVREFAHRRGVARAHPARSVPCPWCQARRGEPCTSGDVPFRSPMKVHASRVDTYVAEGGDPVHPDLTARQEGTPDEAPA